MDNTDVVINEDFSKGMDNWWVEGGKKVWVEDNKLYMKADSPDIPGGHVCTAWCKTPISGDVVIQYDAHVLSSSIDANNINFFFHYSDPSGTSLLETRTACLIAPGNFESWAGTPIRIGVMSKIPPEQKNKYRIPKLLIANCQLLIANC